MTLLRRSRAEEGDGGGGGPPPSDKQSAASAVGAEAAFAFESDDGDENDEEDPLLLHSALASLHKQQTVIEVTACKTRTPSPAEAAVAAGDASGTDMQIDTVVHFGINFKWMEIHLYRGLYSSTITWQ